MMKGFKSTTLVLAALSALFCLNPMDARAEQTAVVQEANQSKKISGQTAFTIALPINPKLEKSKLYQAIFRKNFSLQSHFASKKEMGNNTTRIAALKTSVFHIPFNVSIVQLLIKQLKMIAGTKIMFSNLDKTSSVSNGKTFNFLSI